MLSSLPFLSPILRVGFLATLAWCSIAVVAPVFAADALAGCVPWRDALANRDDLVVGAVAVRAEDLFDARRSGQALAVHRVANALHVATRESTVRHALTVGNGDPFALAALAEAERALRAKRYLREASVTPARLCGNAVDIDVHTVDNWTLTPSVSFGSAGGVSRLGVELQDLNLFGSGKELVFRLKESGDERSALFGYIDGNVLGTHHRLALELGDTEDGEVYGLAGGLPFYASTTPSSWWLSARRESDAFETSTGATPDALVDRLRVEGEVARQRTIGEGVSVRHRLGFRHERQETELPAGSDIETNDFEELYPFVGLSWQRSRWSERRNYFGLGHTEDIDLGSTLSLEIGLVLEALGSGADAVRIELASSRGWQSTPNAIHRLELGITQYVGNQGGSRSERHAETLRYQHFRWFSETKQLDLPLVAGRHVGRSPADALRLGGEYGLKGYPNAYARGGSRIIGLAELRHVTGWVPFEPAVPGQRMKCRQNKSLDASPD